MLFTDPVFLFLFLPLVLTAYYLSKGRGRNWVLLTASFLFYAFGEGVSTFVVLGSIAINFLLGKYISRTRRGFAAAIAINIFLIIVFKYCRFVVENLNGLLAIAHIHGLKVPKIKQPLGISFFTFHALSYITDVWRKEVKPMKRAGDFALYIMLFPQLIAGPIIRYKTIRDQFEVGGETGRTHSADKFANGVKRFIIGFAKKMLIANTVALTVDTIFGTRPAFITPAVAWLGVVCYTIQIYFDFSGYSDMAIGLGQMFGFIFPENFNYPYTAVSISDFWRRWHITLSTWFRDYLYIPLGGNRVSKWRVYCNLLIVFFLCGLWHGPTWTFVLWGLFHGVFLILERRALKNFVERWKILRHVYVLIILMIGWVFFRADNLEFATQYLSRMAFLPGATQPIYTLAMSVTPSVLLAIAAGVIGSVPIMPMVARAIDRARSGLLDVTAGLGEFAGLAAMFLVSASLSAAGTYNPFIYFRF